MLRPGFHRLPALVFVIVQVVDAAHAAEALADVVDRSLDHLGPDAQPGAARDEGPAQIVEAPIGQRPTVVRLRDQGIKSSFGLRDARDRRRACRREEERRAGDARQAFDDSERRTAKRHDVCAVVLRPLTRNRPRPRLQIEFVPGRLKHLRTTLAGEDEELHRRPEWVTERLGRSPHKHQLAVGELSVALDRLLDRSGPRLPRTGLSGRSCARTA